MPESEKIKIANAADMIVDGYAYTKLEKAIRVVNLNKKKPGVMIFTPNGTMIESSMDPIEESIALQKWAEDKEFTELIDVTTQMRRFIFDKNTEIS